jgi:hypothetical protein
MAKPFQVDLDIDCWVLTTCRGWREQKMPQRCTLGLKSSPVTKHKRLACRCLPPPAANHAVAPPTFLMFVMPVSPTVMPNLRHHATFASVGLQSLKHAGRRCGIDVNNREAERRAQRRSQQKLSFHEAVPSNRIIASRQSLAASASTVRCVHELEVNDCCSAASTDRRNVSKHRSWPGDRVLGPCHVPLLQHSM